MQPSLWACLIGQWSRVVTTGRMSVCTRTLVLACMAIAHSTQAQVCDPELLRATTSPQPYTTINSATTWDPDGDGPLPRRLVTAEYFRDLDFANYHTVVRWTDETGWDETPFSWQDDRTRITAMCEWDPDGSGPQPTLLVVTRSIEALVSTEIVLFDGASFTPLGEAFDGTVTSLCAVDHDADPETPKQLFATGDFQSSGGSPVHYLARWTGSAWQDVAGGLEWRAQHMVAWDSDGPGPLPEWLAIGGEFVRAGGIAGQGDGSIPASGVAIWDHSQWSALPEPLQYFPINGANRPVVNTMTTWDPDGDGPLPSELVVGGWFNTPGFAIRNLVAWDGHAMQGFALTNGGYGVLAAAQVDHDFTPGTPRALTIVANSSIASTNPAQLYAYENLSFTALSPDGLLAGINIEGIFELDQSDFADQRIVVVGDFTRVGSLNIRNIVQWTPGGWTPPSPGIVNDTVPPVAPQTLTPIPRPDGSGTNLLVTGISFRDHRGDQFAPLAIWDGEWFSNVPQSVFSLTRDAILWDPDGSGPLGESLVVAGRLANSTNGVIYRQVGDQWIRLGTFSDIPGQLAKWDHDANPDTPDILVTRDSNFGAIYRFDGSNWRQMNLPVSATARRLCVADLDGPGGQPPALYVACSGTPPDALRVFYGPTLESMPVGERIVSYTNSVNAATNRSLFIWDADGSGPIRPVLIWAGTSVLWQGQEVLGLLAWDGSQWTRVARDGLSYNAPYVLNATAWSPNGPDAPQSLAVMVSARSLYTKTGSSPWTYVSALATSCVLAPWDVDGDGPIPEQLVIWGTLFDWAGRQLNYGVSTFAPPLPWIARTPTNTVADQSNTIQLSAAPAWGYAERDEGLQFQWRRDGVPIIDGPQGASPGGGIVSGAAGTLLGSRDLTLTISNARRSDTGYYDLVLTNSCGSTASAPAELYIEPACPADIDDSGTLNELDIARFLASFESGLAESDLDRSGGIDAADIAAFFDSYSSGCP